MATSDNHEGKKTGDFTRRDFLKAAGGTMALAAIPSFLQLSAHAQASDSHVSPGMARMRYRRMTRTSRLSILPGT